MSPRSDWTVNALMPAIHDRLTGGSVYNNRVLEHLAKQARVELHLDSPGGGGLWLVDSLCLHQGAAHLESHSGASGVLIAHYLNVLDARDTHRNTHRKTPRDAAEAEMAALRRYQAVITTSEFSRRMLLENGFAGQIAAIQPGLENSYRRPVAARSSDRPRILTVGSLLRAKGVLDLLAALENLSNRNWSWEIIGDDGLDAEFAREFHQRLNASPVRDRISARGSLPPEQVETAYDRCDIFALPSRFESCSMATMEAMARGLPVAAFRAGGLPDLLPEPSRRMLADVGDMQGFIDTLKYFLVDENLRRSLGEANCSASERFPPWEQTGATVESFLRSVWRVG